MAGENRIAAGFDRIFYGVNNSDGILIGNDATGAAAGNTTGQSLLRLEGARTIPVAIPEPERVTVTGDNEPKVSFNFPSADLPQGILEMAVRDQSFEALVQGTKEQVLGDLSIGSLMPSGANSRNMCLLLMRQAKKWEGAARGSTAWEILFVPTCEITPLYADITERQFSPYRYSINLSKSARAPWGATFTEGLHGTTEMPLVPIESDNPVMVHAWQGNAVVQAFNLAYTPKTIAKVHAFMNNGVHNPGATVAGLTVTYGAVPANGQYCHALYEVDAGDL